MQKTIKIIRDYVEDTSSSLDTAIMLNGSWGSGKTYFVKKELIPALGEEKCVYVSLNGVKSADEITDRILLSIMGSDAGSEKKLWTSFYKFAKKADWGTKGNIARDFAFAFSGYLKDITINRNLKGCLLIVDDLERVSDDLLIKDVLGFFCTHFIEKQKQKIFFICNESEIKDPKYDSIKEKSISWTIEYAPKLEECFDSIVRNTSLVFHNKFLNETSYNKSVIMKLFKTAKITNLRTVIKITEIINRILGDEYESIDNDIALRLYRMVTMLVNETSLGEVDIGSEEFIKVMKHFIYLSPDYKIGGKPVDERVYNKVGEFVGNYFSGQMHLWLYLKSVHNYISSYDYDKDKIWDDIKILRTPAQKAYDHFENRFFLDSEDEVQQVLVELKDHIIRDGYDTFDLRLILAQMWGVHFLELDQTNINEIKELILDKVEQRIRECSSSSELEQEFHFFVSKYDDRFSRRIKPIYDAKLSELQKSRIIQVLTSPNWTELQETIKSGKFFTQIIEHDCEGYIYQMSVSNLAIFRSAWWGLDQVIDVGDDVIQKEVESINSIIDRFMENMSDDVWKRRLQNEFLSDLEGFGINLSERLQNKKAATHAENQADSNPSTNRDENDEPQ